MNSRVNERPRRKAYEAPSVARIIVDPVREMLVDCSASPGKNPPGSVNCQSDPVCCTTQS
ncbi:MAG TPA: hypothetical protein VF761_16220 [Gemmatimonadaceae bacterium]